MRELTVTNALPTNLAAINTSPAPLGGSVSLSIGQLPTATTYTWAGPATYTATGRQQTLAALTEAQVGTYTVTVALAGGCTYTSTTEVLAAGCDFYVEARNAAGTETTELSRIGASVVGAAFAPLTLKVLPFTGTIPYEKYSISWYKNGTQIPGAAGPTYTANTPGKYTVQLKVILSPSTVCEASTNLNAKPCKTYTDVACGGPIDIALPNTQAAGVELIAGDKFTAGDFTIVVSSITSGSPAGYTGEGYLEMRLVAGIVAKRIGVTFTNAVIKPRRPPRYELAGGKVETMYDPDWKGVADVDQTVEDVKNAIRDLKALFNSINDNIEVLDCSQAAIAKVKSSLDELNAFNTNFGDMFEVPEALKTTYQTNLTVISGSISCKIQQTCPSLNAKINIINNDCDYEASKTLFDKISEEFATLTPIETLKNIILFVNGYRSPWTELNVPQTDNQVVNTDRHAYWEGIDTKFKQRRGADNSFYADGSLSITTSNHKSVAGFTASAASILTNYPFLNTAQNNIGFNERLDAGRIAAIDFTNDLAALRLNNTKLKFNLDIVVHSMGFAYAQGIIDEITKSNNFISKHITITGYYIIAAENACGGTLKSSVLGKAQVWQYGSNLGQRNPDPMHMQDGVAPQCAVKGLAISRRAFTPDKYTNGTEDKDDDTNIPKSFLDSHSVVNYKWIFEMKKSKNDKGFIDKQN